MHSHDGTSAIVSTIGDVAERAKVSRTTVSHVINHADRVSKPLRERVQRAIDELGYSPNPQAQSLRTGRTNVVAMLIADILNAFFPEMVKTAQSELERVGLDMLIFNTDVPGGRSQEHAREYLKQIRRRRVDGLIVGDVALHGMHDALLHLDLPAVFIGYLPNKAVDSVRTDGFQGGYLIGQYLAKKGHRRVANVTGPSFFEEAVARSDGFEQGLADHGAPMALELRFEGTYLPPSGREAAKWLIENHGGRLPTAVLFANHLMASGALAEFYDRGIKVPDDIAVAVFDDLPELEYVRPRLTRVGVSPRVLAQRASAMLIRRLNEESDEPPRTEVVPCVLREFDTA
jgi:DNA-binding LacI/PurR family transcriptional regulator